MLSCTNVKCQHYRVRKEIDYTAALGGSPFSMCGMPKLVSYGECRYSYCKLRARQKFPGSHKK